LQREQLQRSLMLALQAVDLARQGLPRLFLRPFLELVVKLALCRARLRSIDGVLPFERGAIARKPYRSMRSRSLNHVNAITP
jgi:hypothetical protein